jgi:hypothetical protein
MAQCTATVPGSNPVPRSLDHGKLNKIRGWLPSGKVQPPKMASEGRQGDGKILKLKNKNCKNINWIPHVQDCVFCAIQR